MASDLQEAVDYARDHPNNIMARQAVMNLRNQIDRWYLLTDQDLSAADLVPPTPAVSDDEDDEDEDPQLQDMTITWPATHIVHETPPASPSNCSCCNKEN
jgi:hypothetical protein